MPNEILIPFDEHFEKPLTLPDASEETQSGDVQALINSPSYSIAFHDQDFIRSDVARSIRIQLEMNKPEWFMRQYGIRSTVIVFGSARLMSRNRAMRHLESAKEHLANRPNDSHLQDALKTAERDLKMSVHYEQAREFARIVSEDVAKNLQPDSPGPYDYVICTGGGPGIMEAANRGAHDVGALSIGLNIKLPYEQRPNPYISPQLCFQFHYFNVRKLHFMLRAKALVACPGGFGTFDELFESLTLRQTERMQKIPIILLGVEFWKRCVDFDYLVETGVIGQYDLKLFHFTDSPQEAWDIIKAFYR
ncbi:3-isopropylmalate dehydrogenase [Planctomycetales bacterium]|nr:3-isopropylmalate dehydrogenase [Planctomycetales bacterium]